MLCSGELDMELKRNRSTAIGLSVSVPIPLPDIRDVLTPALGFSR